MDNTKKEFNDIPDDILENKVLAFLNLNDLFYSVRGVNSEWSNIMKNLWCERIKSEMLDQVNSIDFLYEKEVLTKTYEFKVKYLINYKKLFNLYLANIDIVTIIKLVLNLHSDEKVKNLIKSFFSFLDFNNPIEMIDINTNLEVLTKYLDDERVVIIEKVLHLMNIDSLHDLNADLLKDFKEEFLKLD